MHGSCGRQGHRSRSVERLIPADEVRASDAERELIVGHLREQSGEGRLTVEELDERLGRAYDAKTRAELVALTSDLPAPPRPSQSVARAREDFRHHLRTYAGVMLLLVAIWALTGADYFWPVWPALGWGIGVLAHGDATRRTVQAGRRRAQLGRVSG